MKQVIIDNEDKTVDINKINEDKIYAFSGPNIYKLICIVYGKKYFWGALNNTSSRYDDTSYNSMEEAIRLAMSLSNKVYEFGSLKEFTNWVNEQ
jgi:hypothetical protein